MRTEVEFGESDSHSNPFEDYLEALRTAAQLRREALAQSRQPRCPHPDAATACAEWMTSSGCAT
jgi:hypothetical protein